VDRWTPVVEKHPVLRGQTRLVADSVEQPDEIRQSHRSPEHGVIVMKDEAGQVIGIEVMG
jgi:hypothetical protein